MTGGKWEVLQEGQTWVVKSGGVTVALCWQSQADAELIAQAPAMARIVADIMELDTAKNAGKADVLWCKLQNMHAWLKERGAV